MTFKEFMLAVAGRSEPKAAGKRYRMSASARHFTPIVNESAELSELYLDRLQQSIDTELKPDSKFTSVSRASW